MASFAQTINPCAFNFFTSEPAFQVEADNIVTYVKQLLGDSVLSVELTKKQIWTCLEEATCEYSRLVNEMRMQSDIVNVLGMPTGSGDELTNAYMHQTLEFLMRQAEPYASEANVGGAYQPTLGYINMQGGKQDYDIYTDLINAEVSPVTSFLTAPLDPSSTVFNVQDASHFPATPFTIGIANAMPINDALGNVYTSENMNVTNITGNTITVTRGANHTLPTSHNDQAQVAQLTQMFLTQPVGERGKIEIVEIFHFEPFAAQTFLLNASNVTNFLATNFNYESYVNSTIFYVLPVFEDVLRRSMLETAFRVRRSNYSYEILGSKLRIYPIPTSDLQVGKLWIKVFNGPKNPINPTGIAGGQDDTIHGVSSVANAPYGNIPFSNINQPGRQWIRQYVLALSKELLGLIRGKMKTIPIPGSELTLNYDDLLTQGREDQLRLRDQLKEWLSNFTNQKLLEAQAAQSVAMISALKAIPFRHAIVMG